MGVGRWPGLAGRLDTPLLRSLLVGPSQKFLFKIVTRECGGLHLLVMSAGKVLYIDTLSFCAFANSFLAFPPGTITPKLIAAKGDGFFGITLGRQQFDDGTRSSFSVCGTGTGSSERGEGAAGLHLGLQGQGLGTRSSLPGFTRRQWGQHGRR